MSTEFTPPQEKIQKSLKEQAAEALQNYMPKFEVSVNLLSKNQLKRVLKGLGTYPAVKGDFTANDSNEYNAYGYGLIIRTSLNVLHGEEYIVAKAKALAEQEAAKTAENGESNG